MRPPCQPTAKCLIFEIPRGVGVEAALAQCQINDALQAHDIRAIYHALTLDPWPGQIPDRDIWLLVFGRAYVPCDDRKPPQ